MEVAKLSKMMDMESLSRRILATSLTVSKVTQKRSKISGRLNKKREIVASLMRMMTLRLIQKQKLNSENVKPIIEL
jgi:hypothetical protein